MCVCAFHMGLALSSHFDAEISPDLTLHTGSFSLLTCSHHSLGISLFSVTRCSGLILHFLCFSPGVSHPPMEPAIGIPFRKGVQSPVCSHALSAVAALRPLPCKVVSPRAERGVRLHHTQFSCSWIAGLRLVKRSRRWSS